MRGPVVAHLVAAFADDWQFETREELDGTDWFPDLQPVGSLAARGIPSGPHEPLERIRWVLHAGIAGARESLRIATPYFLPDESMTIALSMATLRGVGVDIIVPEPSHPQPVDWPRPPPVAGRT